MRIDLIYRKVCDRCEGKGKGIVTSNPEVNRITGGMIGNCKSCSGKGYTEETMMFDNGWFDQFMFTANGIFTYKRIDPNGPREEVNTFDKNILDLNPISLKVIEEKECPYCVGAGRPRLDVCHICHGEGKIEVETSFIVFDKSQEEYDREIQKRTGD